MSTRQPLDYYLNLEYPFTVVPDDGSFFIEFLDLKGCMTQVEDASEIGAMAEEIRALWLATAYEQGLPIPEPAIGAEYSGKFMLRVPKSLHGNLVQSARREGMSLNTYALQLLSERHAVASVESGLRALQEQIASLTEQHSSPRDEAEGKHELENDRRRGLKLVYSETVAV